MEHWGQEGRGGFEAQKGVRHPQGASTCSGASKSRQVSSRKPELSCHAPGRGRTVVDATCDLTAPGSRLRPCPPSENSMTQVGGAGPFWQKVSGLRSRHPCCVCGRGGGCARSRGHRLPCLAQRAASPGEQRRGSHEGLEGRFGGLGARELEVMSSYWAQPAGWEARSSSGWGTGAGPEPQGIPQPLSGNIQGGRLGPRGSWAEHCFPPAGHGLRRGVWGRAT